MCHCVSRYSFCAVIVAFAWVDALSFHQLLFLSSSLSHHPSRGSPPVRVKSRHARSDVIVTDPDNDTSLHSFTFSPFIFFPEYRWLDSYLDVTPQIVAFAWLERQPLLTAIGLLLVSSTVSLSIPFTVGKLIDYFTSANPVCQSLDARHRIGSHRLYPSTDNSLWFLADPSYCWSFSRIYSWRCLQCGTRLSHAYVWCVALNIFLKCTFHFVPRSANSCSPARTNLCCNPSARSRIR